MSLTNFGFQTKENKQSAFQTKNNNLVKSENGMMHLQSWDSSKIQMQSTLQLLCFLPHHMQQFINGKV